MNVGAWGGHEPRAPSRVRDQARRSARWVATCVLLASIAHGGCKGTSRHTGALQGIVEFEERTLSFETGGRLVELTVKEGDEVTAGQSLAKLDARLEQAMPAPAQWLAQALPLTHFLRIVRGIVLKGAGFVDVLPELVWMSGILGVLIALGSLRFTKKLP